jgi:hypothetical protein
MHSYEVVVLHELCTSHAGFSPLQRLSIVQRGCTSLCAGLLLHLLWGSSVARDYGRCQRADTCWAELRLLRKSIPSCVWKATRICPLPHLSVRMVGGAQLQDGRRLEMSLPPPLPHPSTTLSCLASVLQLAFCMGLLCAKDAAS